MKTIKFEVELTFTCDISDDNEIKDVAQNIMDAIVRQRDVASIASDKSDCYTLSAKVCEPFSETVIEADFLSVGYMCCTPNHKL